jgi:predicted ATPase/class 3 adenylate cyclase
VTAENAKTDREQLEQAIAALENQRGALGDAVVDAALASIREKLSTLIETEKATQQRKLATVLFMDIVGSTSMAQDLDPEDTMTIMNAALRRLADPVYANGGQVANYMGDGFMALFGAPVARENDPEMGVRAGLRILAEAQVYAQEMEAQWHIPDFNVRVGISTGLVIISGDTEAENTLTGSTVNLAARLESAAKPGTLLISDHTHQHVRDLFDLQLLEPIHVKGFANPVQVYQVHRTKPRTFSMSSWSVAGIETRMVGRDAELLMLQNMFRDATEGGEVHVVTIVGEAGVGKSRLLHEFEKWIALLPEEVLSFKGRTTPEAETAPYGLIRRMLTFHFDILESDSAAEVRNKFRVGLAAVLNSNQADLVGQLLGFDFSASQVVQDRLSSESFGEQAISYLTDFLRAIASEPTVILLEDIHWADDSSLDILNHLTEEMPGSQLLIVCLARPLLFERRPNWGEGQETHTQINLKTLSRRASRALVREILQKADDVPTELRDMIVEGSEGNPFYVEELIKMLIEDAVIVHGEKRWWIELERLAEVRVPPTLTGILQARLDSLPQEEKTVLQQASVVGRLFWDAVVAELASDKVEAAQVDKLLADMRGRELIFRREQSVFEATDEYIFKHALLRDVTYETVLLKLRRVYHAQVAHWLESTAGERIGEYLGLIARHYELAGEKVKTIDYLRRLGEESLQVSAFRDAIRAFERALVLLPDVGEDQVEGTSTGLSDADLSDRAMLLVNLGNLHNRVGDYPLAIQHLEQGLALARQTNDKQAEIAALNRLAQVATERGIYDTAQCYLDEVLVLAREQDDLACVASTLAMLSTIAWRWGDLELTEKCCHESLAIYRELSDRHGISQMLNILGILATIQENFDQAEHYYEQALRMVREIDDPQTTAVLLNNLGYLNHHSTHNLEKANRYYQESLLIAREIDHRSGMTSTLNNLGHLHILLGEQRIALEYLHEALIDSVAIGAVPLTLEALAGVAHLKVEVGQYASAAELLGLILNHPALETDVSQVAESVLDKLQGVLPSAQLEKAMEAGKMLELEAVVAELDEIGAEIFEGPTDGAEAEDI